VTPLRTTFALLLLTAAMLLAVGCMIGDRICTAPGPSESPIPIITKISNLKEQPSGYWIRMEPISDKTAGEVFDLSTTTNLSVDEKVLVQVYYANHTSLDRRKFSGLSDYTNVLAGSNGINRTLFTVNTSGYYPAWYIATEGSVSYNSPLGYTYFRVFPKQNETGSTTEAEG
jgi:hypothetical protein